MSQWTVLVIATKADQIVREWDIVVIQNNARCGNELRGPRLQSQTFLAVQSYVFRKMFITFDGVTDQMAESPRLRPVHGDPDGTSGIVEQH
jgi:hypothetical protein